jgi:MFS family permease
MTTFAGMIFYATSIAMPKLFEERLDLWGDTRSGIGGLVAVIYVIAAMTQIVVGIMVDRYPIKLLLIAVIGLQVPLLLLVASAEGYWLPLAALMLPARQARPAAA